MPRYTFLHGDQLLTLMLERQDDGHWLATFADQTYSFAAAPIDGGWRLTFASGQQTVYTAKHSPNHFAWVNGSHIPLHKQADGQRRKASASSASGRLMAQMPGQVQRVLVSIGDSVMRGQTLLTLEAMKMELRVTAPFAGWVSAVHVYSGAVVERDALLIELRPDDGSVSASSD